MFAKYKLKNRNEIRRYEALWYNAHPKTQALYALALRRCLTPPRLTAGGLIELNMESFSEVTYRCSYRQ